MIGGATLARWVKWGSDKYAIATKALADADGAALSADGLRPFPIVTINNEPYVWSPILGGYSPLSASPVIRVRGVAVTNIATLSGVLVHDGITYATGDLILLAGQTAGASNGIWAINSEGAWSRYSLHATSDAIRLALAVVADDGTAEKKGNTWACTNNAPISVGVDAIAFSRRY